MGQKTLEELHWGPTCQYLFEETQRNPIFPPKFYEDIQEAEEFLYKLGKLITPTWDEVNERLKNEKNKLQKET